VEEADALALEDAVTGPGFTQSIALAISESSVAMAMQVETVGVAMSSQPACAVSDCLECYEDTATCTSCAANGSCEDGAGGGAPAAGTKPSTVVISAIVITAILAVVVAGATLWTRAKNAAPSEVEMQPRGEVWL